MDFLVRHKLLNLICHKMYPFSQSQRVDDNDVWNSGIPRILRGEEGGGQF